MKTTEEAVLELSQPQQEALIRSFGLEETNTRHIDCPFCGKKNKQGDGCRISWTDKLGGQSQYASICAGCGPKGIMAMLYGMGATIHDINREIGFKYGSDAPAEPVPVKVTRETRLIDAFKAAIPTGQSEHARQYFYNRGIHIVPTRCVRVHPMLPYRDNTGKVIGEFDAIMSCATNALGRPSYMHITWIKDGYKVDLGENPARKQYSLVPNGMKPRCSIKFRQRSPEVLAVAEGIESALSYEQIYSVPTDSCLNADLLSVFRPAEYVRELHIARDTDKKWAGQAAAHKLLHGVACHCPWVKRVVIRGPEEFGEDFNDILLTGGGVDELVWNR